MLKRKDEVENIRNACKLTDQCFENILKKLKPGVSEKQIARFIRKFFKKKGVKLSFPPIVAFGESACEPHHRTNDTKLRKRDIILLDFGCRVHGYCSDMTRTVFIGKPKPEWVRAYKTVLSAQNSVLYTLKNRFHVSIHESGVDQKISGAKLDYLAKSVIKKAGFPPYKHSLGHNVGLAIHEQPRLTIKKDATLLPGMVFSVEPGIYIDGRYGIRIEDLVLLKKSGIEILTKSPKALTIL